MSSVVVKIVLDQPGCLFNALPCPYIPSGGRVITLRSPWQRAPRDRPAPALPGHTASTARRRPGARESPRSRNEARRQGRSRFQLRHSRPTRPALCQLDRYPLLTYDFARKNLKRSICPAASRVVGLSEGEGVPGVRTASEQVPVLRVSGYLCRSTSGPDHSVGGGRAGS